MNKVMTWRITIFTKFFWPEGGGAELATYVIVKRILSKVFDTVIISGTWGPKLDSGCYKYIHWSILRSRFKPLEWLKLFMNSYVVRKLVANADIVYVPSHTLLPLAIAVKKLNPRVRVVLHLHNYQPLTYTSVVLSNALSGKADDVLVELWENNSLGRASATGLLRYSNIVNVLALYYADAIICVSRRQAEIIASRLPSIRGKIRVVYNPLPNLPPPEAKSKKPLFVYPGGGSFIKGFHIFIRTAIEVLRRYRDISFVLTGGWRKYKSDQLKLLKRIPSKAFSVLERLPYEEVLKLYSSAWAVVVPSIWEEPLPYVVMESMAVGTLPIASRVGGIPEIVKGTYAERMLFTPGDHDELANKVEEALTLSKEELANIGSRLRESVSKRFGTEIVRRELLDVFQV